MMMTMESAAVRVSRGVALLDEKRPGWWERVDPERLNMQTACGCVLGQLEGEYCAGVKAVAGIEMGRLWSRNAFGVHYGFDVPLASASILDDEGYDGLQAEWLRVIAVRRVQAEAPTAVWTHREREPVR